MRNENSERFLHFVSGKGATYNAEVEPDNEVEFCSIEKRRRKVFTKSDRYKAGDLNYKILKFVNCGGIKIIVFWDLLRAVS